MKTTPSKTDKPVETTFPGFEVLDNPCIWMKAGVVNFRLCDRDYDCFHCPFDTGMRQALDAQFPAPSNGKADNWAADMRKKYPGHRKPCAYALAGEKEAPRYCTRNYDCDDCPVEMALGYPYSVSPDGPSDQPEKAVVITEALSEGKRPHTPERGLENECIWMKAGIVNFHLCTNDFDCYHCPFDFSMRAAMAPEAPPEKATRGAPPIWEERVTEDYEPVMNACIHFLKGEAEAPAVCEHAYECFQCPIHKALSQKRPLDPAPLARPRYRKASGYRLAEGYYYHFGHSWVQVLSGNCVRVGMDDFAARLLGPADALDVAPTGASIKQGGVGWVLQRGEHRAPMQAPLSGKIIAVNEKAASRPELAHDDPYQDGWLFQMDPAFLKMEAEGLFSGTESDQWIEAENRALLKTMGPAYEKLAATGGEALDDLVGKVPGIEWDPLVRTFLHMGSRI